MVVGGVERVPGHATSLLASLTFRVPRREDVHVVACLDETRCKRSRVILHAPETMACDSNDADPHEARS
jgi:hypothetical protein